MAKQLTPRMGRPVHEFLKEEIESIRAGNHEWIKETEDSLRTAEGLDKIDGLQRIVPLVNEEVCGTTDQLRELGDRLLFLIKDHQSEAYDPNIAIGVNLANSLRLKCSNCLNETCDMRDPSYPVNDVKKRLPVVE